MPELTPEADSTGGANQKKYDRILMANPKI
jgi:hypothetical protein